MEIAPTKIFAEQPYDRKDEAREWSNQLRRQWDLHIVSMQSIWYGKTERIFGSEAERYELMEYTKKAIDFAETIDCKNLVFGCPKNRAMPDGADIEMAVSFFRELGNYAHRHHCVVAMEANPPIYHTNFLNTTGEAMAFVETVGSEGFLLNLDTGTMIENGEDVSQLDSRERLIHHVHISEPGLKPIQKRKLHTDLAIKLKDMNYQGFVSIEVGQQNDRQKLTEMMEYVAGIFL